MTVEMIKRDPPSTEITPRESLTYHINPAWNIGVDLQSPIALPHHTNDEWQIDPFPRFNPRKHLRRQ